MKLSSKWNLELKSNNNTYLEFELNSRVLLEIFLRKVTYYFEDRQVRNPMF